MNSRQIEALAYIQEHGRITNREYRRVCPNWSAETLRLDLVDLCGRGILRKIGTKRGTHYVPKGPPTDIGSTGEQLMTERGVIDAVCILVQSGRIDSINVYVRLEYILSSVQTNVPIREWEQRDNA